MSLIKAALITALIGLVALIFLSENLEPRLTRISDISKSNIDSFVKIQGLVISLNQKEDFSSMKINDGTENITAICWEKTNITKNSNIEIIGKVVEWHGILEIQAETIRNLDVSDAPKTD